MNFGDLIIGGLGVILGGSFVAAAAWNSDWSFQWRKARWIEARWGRSTARIVYVVLGVSLLGLGLFVLAGRG